MGAVSYPYDNRQIEDIVGLSRQQNFLINQQNANLKILADSAQKSAEESSKAAKRSSVCTIITTVCAVLMFFSSVANVVVGVLSYLK